MRTEPRSSAAVGNLQKDVAMKSIAPIALVIALSAGPAAAQVNMQYNGQANGQYSGQYSGQSNGQVSGQVDGRADRDKTQGSGEAAKQVAPVDRPAVNDAQSMDAVERPGLDQR
jgi:hypothetical protein